ncbi:MAG: DUF3461 family protein [Rhodobacteraceae bacterium]|nr:DUF3461 family protein [Paracoccaceae bacterium]
MGSTKTSALTEMGVVNSDQIIGYSLIMASVDTDVIRINYKRPSGSFLPRRRTYEFKRIGKPKRGMVAANEDLVRYEISPLLRRAVDELDVLLADRTSKKTNMDQIQREIDELRQEVDTRLAHIGKLLEGVDTSKG